MIRKSLLECGYKMHRHHRLTALLHGAASIVQIQHFAGDIPRLKLTPRSDLTALWGDWQAVGRDVTKAYHSQ